MCIRRHFHSEVVANNYNAMHTARKHFIACKFSEKQDVHFVSKLGYILQSYKYCDIVFSKRNMIDDLSPGTVIKWEHKQMFVKHKGTNVRVPLSHLTAYTGAYQSPSEDDKIIKPTPSTSQTWPDKTLQVSVFEENNTDEEL